MEKRIRLDDVDLDVKYRYYHRIEGGFFEEPVAAEVHLEAVKLEGVDILKWLGAIRKEYLEEVIHQVYE
jgi:hypothetical protein